MYPPAERADRLEKACTSSPPSREPAPLTFEGRTSRPRRRAVAAARRDLAVRPFWLLAVAEAQPTAAARYGNEWNVMFPSRELRR